MYRKNHKGGRHKDTHSTLENPQVFWVLVVVRASYLLACDWAVQTAPQYYCKDPLLILYTTIGLSLRKLSTVQYNF